jgi:flagellin-like hook-associated protein FlgL
MIRGIDAQTQRFLIDIGRTQRRVTRANDQLNSGLRVTKPSDAPERLGSIFRIQTGLEQMEQYQRILTEQRAELTLAEQVLQQGIQLMDRAVALATQGATSTTTVEMRQILSDQVANLHEQMVALSRTVVANRHVFSGDRENVPLYPAIDRSGDPPLPVVDQEGNPVGVPGVPWSASNPPQFQVSPPINGYSAVEEASNLAGVSANREVMHPAGYSFPVALSATEIFDQRDPNDHSLPTNNNIFYALNRLRFALSAPAENWASAEEHQAYMRESLQIVKQAADHLSRKAGFYGGAMNRVLDGIEYASKLTLQLRTELKEVREADLVSSITDLQQGQIHIETAFKARSLNQNRSLFDYMG